MNEADLLPARIRTQLDTAKLGRRIYYLGEVDSTNRIAAGLARDGEAHGTVVIANHQTQGRGRQGRTWESPGGRNLLFSVVLRPDLTAGEMLPVTLLLSAGVASALSRCTNTACGVKWPNDVVVGGRKICGILSESSSRGGRVDYVVIGVGVNVNVTANDFPPALRGIATSCAELAGRTFDRADVFSHVLHELESAYDLFCRRGFAHGKAWYLSYCDMPGRRIRFEHGGRELTAVVDTVADDGALIVSVTGEGQLQLYDEEVHVAEVQT